MTVSILVVVFTTVIIIVAKRKSKHEADYAIPVIHHYSESSTRIKTENNVAYNQPLGSMTLSK